MGFKPRVTFIVDETYMGFYSPSSKHKEIQLMWKKDKVSSRSIKILVKDENIAEAHYIYVFVI